MKKTSQTLIAALMLASLPALAADKTPAPPPGSTPVPDGAPAAGEIEEPSITIRSRGGERVEEYRLRGKLYMIRITPPKGSPYYLIDQMGRGEFTRHEGPVAPTAVPHWVLKTF
jgi:hypothetical protein